MIRTSITLPPALHQRLTATADELDQTLTERIRQLLDKALAEEETRGTAKMYSNMKKLRAVAKTADPTISSTIDETLYGKQGAWKGNENEE